MITAVDTSVLISIYKGEPDGQTWLGALERRRKSGGLVICDVVAAEFYALVLDDVEFAEVLDDLGLEFDPIGQGAACLAGRLFQQYRARGGPRRHLIPDFMIAAHATVQAQQLAAIDRGYFREFFSELELVEA